MISKRFTSIHLIKQIMVDYDLEPQSLAKLAGISYHKVYRIINGNADLTIDEIANIVAGLVKSSGCSEEDVLEELFSGSIKYVILKRIKS